VQNFKCLRAVVMICATLVNIHPDRHTYRHKQTTFLPVYMSDNIISIMSSFVRTRLPVNQRQTARKCVYLVSSYVPFLLRPATGAEYCDQFVCLCVCLSASVSLEPLYRSSRNILCRSPVAVA